MSTDFEVEDVRHLLRRPLEPPRFAVDGLIPRGAVTVLAGRPKHGKSWLALDLALGVGTGRNVLGGVPCAPGPVVYLALEDSPHRMRSRVEALLGETTPPDEMYLAYRWSGGLDAVSVPTRDHYADHSAPRPPAHQREDAPVEDGAQLHGEPFEPQLPASVKANPGPQDA